MATDPPSVAKSDPVRRGIRTLFQVGTVTLAIQGWNLFAPTPLTADQAAWITALGTLLVSIAQNVLEEAGAVPEMMKGPTVTPADANRHIITEIHATSADTFRGH